MADAITQDEFVAAFNGPAEPDTGSDDQNQEPDTGDDAGTDNSQEPDAGQSDEGNANDSDDQDAEGSDDAPDQSRQQADSKRDHAFGQLRIQNKQQSKLLKDIGQILGIQDTSNPEALTKALQDKVIASQAKQQNVPEEVFRRLHNLEQDNQAYIQDRMKRTAFLGFQKIKDTFGLKNEEVTAFADELRQANLDPFTTPVDIVREYQVRNYDKLIAAAEERGAKQEAERAAKAKQHGSTPQGKEGKRRTGGEGKISTIKELNDFLSSD